MKTFSIIVPCCNLEKWIPECLDSIAAQSRGDWECIVVDDGSADGSGAICDGYAMRDARFKVIHQINAGEGAARNAGLEVASGEWVLFVDGDDRIAPGMLARIAEIAARHPGENLIRFMHDQFADGEAVPATGDMGQGGEAETRVVDISKAIGYEDYFVYVWRFAFRRKLIAGLRFKRYRRGSDRTFVMPLICNRLDSFVATDEVLYFYRDRAGSVMNSEPDVATLADEMDHRLEVAEIMDACGKRVEYAGTGWIERYFTSAFPSIMSGREDEFDELLGMWRQRLRRARKLRGFSAAGKWFCRLHTWALTRWLADYFAIAMVRRRSQICRVGRAVKRRWRGGEKW